MILIDRQPVIFNYPENEKTYSNFVSGLRSAVRGFWNGTLSRSEFTNSFSSSIRRNLNQAYDSTANAYGIKRDEYTEDEKSWIKNFTNEQLGYVGNFADAIQDNKKGTGKLAPLLSRVDDWANRWNQVENNATTFFAGNQKLIWNVTPGKKHCVNCGRLNGYVKRASQWRDYPLEPQSPNLACGGHRCGCSFNETDKAMSRGPLPRP